MANETSFSRLVALLVATLMGGRISGILTGLELGLGPARTATLIGLLNTGLLLSVFPAFAGLSRQAVSRGPLSRMFSTTQTRADAHARTLATIGTWALPVFVWLPFPLTGAFVGAAIGLLLHMPWWRLLAVVLGSMWFGIVTWTWGVDYLLLVSGPAGSVACWVITAAVVAYSLATRLRHASGSG
jgi:uncharacterized membrane protein